jgi:hypothetical protein
VGYEVYVRETGKIYTLGHTPVTGGEGRAVFLRQPRDYFGHPRGPYVYFRIHLIPDMLFPLSPLAATQDISEEISLHMGQMKDDAGRAKHFTLIDSKAKGAKEIVKNARNGGVYTIPGLKDISLEVKVGGVDPEQAAYIDRRRADLERRAGITNVSRGETDPNVKATADAIADKHADKRIKYAQRQFRKAVKQILEGMAWLMWYSDQIAIEMPMTDEETGEEYSATFYGGVHEGQEHIPFESLRIEIEPYTMEYVDESTRQRRAMQAYDITTNLGPMLVDLPFLKTDLLDDLFEVNNVQGGAERYIDMDILNQMRQMTMMRLGMEMEQMQLANAATQIEAEGQAAIPAQQRASAGKGGRSQRQNTEIQAEPRVGRLGGKSELDYDPVRDRVGSMSRAA